MYLFNVNIFELEAVNMTCIRHASIPQLLKKNSYVPTYIIINARRQKYLPYFFLRSFQETEAFFKKIFEIWEQQHAVEPEYSYNIVN